MIGTALADARISNRERHILKAFITWADNEFEYELVIKNESKDNDFKAWIEANVIGLASEDADEKGTIFEEIISIHYEYDTIDDDALFENDYMAYAENEWELCTGR